MKSSTKSSILSVLAVLLLGGSAVVFGRLFWNELSFNIENKDGVLVGEVVDIRGQAQRRYSNQSRWGSLKNDESVFNLDAIRTEMDSGAVIVLKSTAENGRESFDEIILGPNTYVVLDLVGKNRNIQFVAGDLSANSSGALTVSAEHTRVSVQDGAVRLNRQDGQETSVSVNRGEARIRSNTEETIAGTNAIFHINESSGLTRREELPLNPLSPRTNALLLTYEPQRTVEFQWELFDDWAAAAVEISQSPDFSQSIKTTFRPASEPKATAQLAPGNWFWRVIGTDSEGSNAKQQGPMNNFSIDVERVVKLISPSDEALIPFRNNVSLVNLQWNPVWFADAYKLEVAKNRNLANPILSKEVSGSSLLMEKLSAGDWWWRITPVYRRAVLDRPPPTATGRFTLEQRLGHAATRLVSPLPNASFSAFDVGDGISFRWTNDSRINSYTLQVSDTQDFSRIIATSDNRKTTGTLLADAKPGRYWWRVEARATDGQPVPPSETRNIEIRAVEGKIELIKPPRGTVLEQEPYSPYNFSWRSAVSGTARYTLYRVLSNGEKTKLIESLVQAESFTAPLPGEGNYAWKVQILDDSGRILVESPEWLFSLQSEFFSPILRRPAPGAVVNILGNETLTLQWDPVPDAQAYSVRFIAPDGQTIVQNDRVLLPELEFLMPSDAREGEYRVELTSIRDKSTPRVAGAPGAGERSQTAVYTFEIAELVRYRAAQLTSPPNNSRFGKLESLRNPVTLSWTQNPNLGRFTVELSNRQVTRLYQTSENSLSLETLEEGDYSWKVLSRDSFGREAPESPSSRFTILPLPPLPRPSIITPNSGQKLDMTGARSLNFAWQPVPGAEFYDFALYSFNSKTPIFRENGLTATTFSLNNLQLLDVGDFRLELKARTEYPDIGLSRESALAIVPFSLSLNISSGAPKILTDELQYAE